MCGKNWKNWIFRMASNLNGVVYCLGITKLLAYSFGKHHHPKAFGGRYAGRMYYGGSGTGTSERQSSCRSTLIFQQEAPPTDPGLAGTLGWQHWPLQEVKHSSCALAVPIGFWDHYLGDPWPAGCLLCPYHWPGWRGWKEIEKDKRYTYCTASK